MYLVYTCCYVHLLHKKNGCIIIHANYALINVSGLFIIEAHEQNSTELPFMVPHVPIIPSLSIICNIVLMTNLNLLTWIRFLIWMVLGELYNSAMIRNNTIIRIICVLTLSGTYARRN